MDPRRVSGHSPFPVEPADVPSAAVRAVKRTLLRHPDPAVEDPMDDGLARLIVAVVIAALSEPEAPDAGVSAEMKPTPADRSRRDNDARVNDIVY